MASKVKVIAVRNNKGGVGKTTMGVHIAAGLATKGYKVALVDTDPQGHVATMFGLAKEDGLYRAMVEKQPLESVVWLLPPERYSLPDHPSTGKLYLLPGAERTFQIPLELKETDTFLFMETMQALGVLCDLDYIFVDTSPTLGLFDGSVHLATDGYLYVTECSHLSFDGMTSIIEKMEGYIAQRKQYLGLDGRIVGVVPNKMATRARIHKMNLQALAESFPDLVYSPVMLRLAWDETTQLGEMIFTSAPSGNAAIEAWSVVNKTEERLKAWQLQSN